MRQQLVPTGVCLPCQDRIIELGLSMIGRAAAVAILLVLMLGLGASGSLAQTKTDGNLLLTRCNEAVKQIDNPQVNGDVYSGGFCIGFIVGMEEARDAVAMSYSRTYEESTKMSVLGIKVPTDVSYGQIARILVKWLQNNPQHLHESASLVYVLAMREAFPAPTEKAVR